MFYVMMYYMIKERNGWNNLFEDECEKAYFKTLENFLNQEKSIYEIYPKEEDIFFAFDCLPLENVKVVIVGQDPYHQPNQAHGLAFSVKDGQKVPPSLRNMFKAIELQLNTQCYTSGNLTRWAKQGVFLLNTVLTVRKDQANSHKNMGWEAFTNKAINILNQSKEPIVFMLWGNSAKSFKSILNNPKHLVLESVHPSPLSAHNGFFTNNHFVRANEFLQSHGKSQIDWR
jgi:uracil-DNA glycosylase